MRLFLVALCLIPAWGAARGQGVSATDWTVAGRTVFLRVTLPAADRLAPGGVLARVDVHAGAAACPAIDQGEGVGQVATLSPLDGLQRVEVAFECPPRGAMRLGNHLLFDRDAGHLDIGSLHDVGDADVPLLFDAGHQDFEARGFAAGEVPGGRQARLATSGFTQSLGRFGLVALGLLLAARLRSAREGLACAAAALLGATTASALGTVGVIISPEPAEAVLALLGVVLALHAAVPRRAPAAALAVVGLVTVLGVAEAVQGHMATVLAMVGTALAAPALASGTRWFGKLVPAAIIGLLGDAAFGTGVRAVQIPTAAAIPVEAWHAAGMLAAVAVVAGIGAGLVQLARKAAWASVAARAGLAGLCAFWLVKALQP